MNQRQQQILIAAGLLVTATLVYVPMFLPYRFIQYNWIFSEIANRAMIDVGRLLIEWVAIGLLCYVSYFIAGNEKICRKLYFPIPRPFYLVSISILRVIRGIFGVAGGLVIINTVLFFFGTILQPPVQIQPENFWDNDPIVRKESEPSGHYFDEFLPKKEKRERSDVDDFLAGAPSEYQSVDDILGPKEKNRDFDFGKFFAFLLLKSLAALMLIGVFFLLGKLINKLNIKIHGVTHPALNTKWGL